MAIGVQKHGIFIIFLLISIILVTLVIKSSPVSAQIYNASTLPAQDSDTLMEFYGAHWGAQNVTTITNFVNTYGVSGWNNNFAPTGKAGYSYVCVYPAQNYSKNLVFLYYTPDLTTYTNRVVVWAELIDKNETFIPLKNFSISTNTPVPIITPSPTNTPGFTLDLLIASIVIILLMLKYIKMN